MLLVSTIVVFFASFLAVRNTLLSYLVLNCRRIFFFLVDVFFIGVTFISIIICISRLLGKGHRIGDHVDLSHHVPDLLARHAIAIIIDVIIIDVIIIIIIIIIIIDSIIIDSIIIDSITIDI